MKIILANHWPHYCHDFSRNRDSLVSLLKGNRKNKISISVEQLYRFKENRKGRKRSNKRIHHKIPAKTYLLTVCGLVRAHQARRQGGHGVRTHPPESKKGPSDEIVKNFK